MIYGLTESQVILLLRLIKVNATPKFLVEQGVDYYEILRSLKKLEEVEYIVMSKENEYRLTDLGLSIYKELNRLLKRTGYSYFISPIDSARVPKIEINSLYLPKD